MSTRPKTEQKPHPKLIQFQDLTPTDTFTKELTPDPATPFGPPIPAWAASQSPHLIVSSNNPNSNNANSTGNGANFSNQPELTLSKDTQPLQNGTNATNGKSGGVSDQTARQSRRICAANYTYIYPEQTPQPILLIHSPSLFNLLQLSPPPSLPQSTSEKSTTNSKLEDKPLITSTQTRKDFAEWVSGSKIPEKFKPWTQNYGGHQFGNYSGQLGDGRCVNLCEISVVVPYHPQHPHPAHNPPHTPNPQPNNTNNNSNTAHTDKKFKKFEIQVKGTGKTPYSRFGDGFCTLSSSLREFFGCEFNHVLGVPSTRALSLVASTSRFITRDTVITRDSSTDSQQMQPCGVVTRVSEGWVRFGTFEVFFYRAEKELLKKLADFVVRNYFFEMLSAKPKRISILRYLEVGKNGVNGSGGDVGYGKPVVVELNVYGMLFMEVVKRTAGLVAWWQAVGFCHGVLNTDNMSILGLTLDYGPFGFLDNYDPSFTPNSSDTEQRYTFENQPKVALWNLSKLGRTFVELVLLNKSGEIDTTKPVKGEVIIKEILNNFETIFVEKYTDLMRKKLGLLTPNETDLEEIILPLLQLMADTMVDYTFFFRSLCTFRTSPEETFLHQLTDTRSEPSNHQPTCKSLNILLDALDNLPEMLQTTSLQQSSVDLLSANLEGSLKDLTTQSDPESEPKSTSRITSPSKSQIPTYSQITTNWKLWCEKYRTRIFADSLVPPDKTENTDKFKNEISGVDFHRQERMKKSNPKYVLRNWILKELYDKCLSYPCFQHPQPQPTGVSNAQPRPTTQDVKRRINPANSIGVSTPTEKRKVQFTNANIVQEPFNQSDGSSAVIELERAFRIMVQDVWGDISESESGWKNDEDGVLTEKLAGLPPTSNELKQRLNLAKYKVVNNAESKPVKQMFESTVKDQNLNSTNLVQKGIDLDVAKAANTMMIINQPRKTSAPSVDALSPDVIFAALALTSPTQNYSLMPGLLLPSHPTKTSSLKKTPVSRASPVSTKTHSTKSNPAPNMIPSRSAPDKITKPSKQKPQQKPPQVYAPAMPTKPQNRPLHHRNPVELNLPKPNINSIFGESSSFILNTTQKSQTPRHLHGIVLPPVIIAPTNHPSPHPVHNSPPFTEPTDSSTQQEKRKPTTPTIERPAPPKRRATTPKKFSGKYKYGVSDEDLVSLAALSNDTVENLTTYYDSTSRETKSILPNPPRQNILQNPPISTVSEFISLDEPVTITPTVPTQDVNSRQQHGVSKQVGVRKAKYKQISEVREKVRVKKHTLSVTSGSEVDTNRTEVAKYYVIQQQSDSNRYEPVQCLSSSQFWKMLASEAPSWEKITG
ncbi:hypothetical protein HK098_000710 [Nowakowskiella sp. JEL0407]|nr:hypothetical protein HK098_000710 [Nowakowskiella sp. JEL0407]